MSLWTEISLLLALLLVNGLLAGAEIAVVTMRASRIDELVSAGSRTARAVRRLRSQPERFLATVQVGITVVGVTAGAFGGATFSEDVAALLARWPLLAPYAASIAFVLVVATITYFSLILGELVPKSLALRAAEPYALLLAGPLEVMAQVFRPAVWLLTASSNAVLRIFGDRTDFLEGRISLEEVRAMVSDASRRGAVDPAAGVIAGRALALGELRAGDVMVHRRFVVALPVDADREQVRAAFLGAGHRRVPVYRASIDDIIGYVTWRDVFARTWDQQPIELERMVVTAQLVPEVMPAIDLLHELLRQRRHLAVVIDEHGGVAGIVTVEDLLEELVGEIESEHGREPQRIRWSADGAALVPGETPVRDVNRELQLKLEEPEDGHTLGALVLALAGDRIPRTGESFTTRDGTRLDVVEASPRRVRRVRLVRPAAEHHVAST